MHRRLAAVLLATAVVAAACGGGTGDGDGDPTATPPAGAAPTTTTGVTPPAGAPATTTTAAGGVEPTPTPPEPDPPPAQAPAPEPPPRPPEVPAPEDGAGTDPGDAYFALDRVLDVSIEIAADDWDTLRHQTRTFEDLLAEIEEYGLSRPFASIYTWFGATVTVDGETHTDVGVRKKGFIGSQSDTKPSLKLRFDKYVDGQSLGGVMERMTLNNGIQDPSMVNTCLSYRVFAAAGNPAPRCNFATVSVNGRNLGLYVHVEEFKAPFLAHHFGSAAGNLYEGTVSDFTPDFRGTIEKKTNEDAADWSDIDAVVAALQDPSDAGLEALGEIVDLDRFLSFWATEVLVGHWDGYAGDRNNYWFYRVPDGRFVFLPWGTDDTFHLRDDPNPFDNIGNPPPSVLALTAIPNRLYSEPDWRDAYVARLKGILEAVWDEEELLAAVDEMAAIVQRHALPEAREAAAADTERVRKFILKRRGEILADLTPEPPDWPEPEGVEPPGGLSGSLAVAFETTWASNQSPDPLEEGKVISLVLNGSSEPVEGLLVTAGHATPDERTLLPGVAKIASIVVVRVEDDGSLNGMVVAVALDELAAGATLVIGADAIAGGIFSFPPGAAAPDTFSPFGEGTLELSRAGTTPGAPIAGSFSGSYGDSPPATPGDGPGAANRPTAATTTTAPAGGAAGVGDSFYPLLGNGGYDVLHYGIDLDVDPAGNTISARATITALATEDMPAFNLDLSGLDVHDVTVDGVAAGFVRSGSELTIRPEAALSAGDEFSVSVGYSGTPEPIDDPGVPFTTLGWHSQDGVIYTLSEPSGAMTWFPSNNHPSDKATFELRITVPASTTAAATGLLIDETTADGRTTTTWRMDDPMATYLAAVYVGDFERVEHGRLGPDGPLLRDYVPGDASPEIGDALAVTADALRFLEGLLGPYPFDAYGTLVLPLPLELALENQTMSVHGPGLLGPDIIAHEAAHQWVGNSVALEDWSDIWLNEGFATYVHLMFDAAHHGADFHLNMQQLHAQLPFFAATPPKGITIEELFSPSVYVRGAMTLHALRLHAGDETFFTILRTHVERSTGSTTNTGEFLAIVDEFAGSEAVALVESWLYDESVPDLPERGTG